MLSGFVLLVQMQVEREAGKQVGEQFLERVERQQAE